MAAATTRSHTYSFAELEQLWRTAGGLAWLAPVMAAIALAESGGDPGSVNHNTNGTTDVGLWQINSVWGHLQTADPLGNARSAVAVYNKQGLFAWSSYKSGAYTKYMPTGAAPKNPGPGVEKGGVQGGLLDTVVPGGETIKQAGSTIGDLVGMLTSLDTWRRLGEVVLGIALVLMGLRSLTGSETTPVSVARRMLP